MISEKSGNRQAFVWIWLPGATEPVVAGKLSAYGDTLVFHYGRSYLERRNAISNGNRPQADVGTSVSEPFCFR